MRLIDITLDGESIAPLSVAPSGTRYDLSIVVPTLNEAKNIPILFASLQTALPDTNWELVIVDDNSKDDSPALLVKMANEHANFRFLRRFGRSGLSTACIEGMMTSAAPVIAVMDADGQHDETKLLQMLAILNSDTADVVVGSRFVEGADTSTFSNFRTKLSLYSNVMAQKWFNVPLKDSMGNFFMLKRPVIEATAPFLCGRGQKLLFDILLVGPKDLRVAEVPIVFGAREHGESKLSHIAAIDFGLQLWDRKFGSILPTKAIIDLTLIFTYSLITTLLTWATMKIWHLATGVFPAAPTLIPIAAFPSLLLAFYGMVLITPKRKRTKGTGLAKELLSYLIIASPFVAMSAWLTSGIMSPGDPRLRLLFGASVVSSVGLVIASNWRKEALARR
ncbi:MAG: glycosyltransferase [Armatimonadota bacterium]